MRNSKFADIIRLTVGEIDDLFKSLRRELLDGKQWVVSILTADDRLPEMKGFISFEGATAYAKEKVLRRNTVRIDSTKYILKVLNRLPLQRFSKEKLADFDRAVSLYPYLTTPSGILASQAFLLGAHFPVIYRKSFSFFNSAFTIWLERAKGEPGDSLTMLRHSLRCTNIIDGLRRLEDVATGKAGREEGETVILMATGGPGVCSRDGTIFYKILPGEPIMWNGRLPVLQIVDPMQSYYEEQLFFCKYSPQAKELTFFDGQLKRTELRHGVGTEGLQWWCPRLLLVETK